MKSKIALLLILVSAFLLRFIGTYPGFNQFHSDEPILYGVAIDMIRNGNVDPGRFDYPGVSIYINYFFYYIVFIPLGWANYFLQHLGQIIDGVVHIPVSPLAARSIRQEFILGHREVNVLIWGRIIAAAFSFGNVLLTYILAKKLFNKQVGLIAALFLAFNFRQVLNSHVNLPDIYNCFFLLLSLLMTYNLWQRPNLKNYLIAGIAAGVAFSTKYQIFALFPIALVHTAYLKKFINSKIIILGLTIPLVFLILNPYFIPSIELALRWISDVSQKYGMGANKLNLYPLSYYFHYDLGPIEFVLVVLGILIAALKDHKKLLFLLSTTVPFFFILNYYSGGGFYIRNYVTITPLLLILAAYAVNKLPLTKILIVGILAIALFVPARNSLVNSYYNTKEWNYQLLSNWMFENIPENSIVASHPFDPPTGTPVIQRTEFELGGSYSLAEHRDNNAEYALMNTDWAGNSFYIWMSYGFADLTKFWNKPYLILRNSFYGIASEELIRWHIFSAVKPWQAPDASLIMAKLPVWPEVQMTTLSQFSFDQDANSWQIRGNFDEVETKDVYDEDEQTLVLHPTGSRFATVRIASEALSIKPGYLYKISGKIKTSQILSAAKRDGFIRIDFYENDNDLENIGIISSVSSRVYGTDEWVFKSIIERAPDNARYMVISLQSVDMVGSSIWLDDLKIEQSLEAIEDVSSNYPYIKEPIDLNLLYPNSHGNL